MIKTISILLVFISLLASCKKGEEGIQQAIQSASTQNIDLTGVAPDRILLTPADIILSAGEVIQLRATGVYTRDFSQAISSGITWTSDNPKVLQVETDGTGKGLVEGSATVTASYLGVTATTKFKVSAPTVSQLMIFPENVSVELALKKGQLQPQDFQLKAYVLMTDGQLLEVTDEVNWSIEENSGLKTLVDKPGQYTAQNFGDWEVKIELGGMETTKTIKVGQQKKALVSIKASANPLVLRIGQSLNLDAVGIYNDESESVLTQDWTLSAASDLFSVSGKQLLGLKTGSVQLKLNSNQMQAPLTIYVQDPELTSISVAPANFTLHLGESANFIVNANYGDGTSAEITSAASVITTNPAVMNFVSDARIQALSQGSANLYVSYRGLTTTALVAVDAPALSRLEIRPSNIRVVSGRTENFQVYGIYTNGTEADLTSLAIAQSLATSRAEVPQGMTGRLLGKANGVTSLSATYVDPFNGRNLSGSAPVTIDPPELLALNFDNTSASVALGRTFDFGIQGSYSDNTAIDVGSQVQITADVSSAGMSYVGSIIRTTGNRIRVQSLAQGTMKIIASLGGQTAIATITVTEKHLDAVQIRRQTPYTNPGFLLKNSYAEFTAVATFSDNSTTDVTSSVGIYTTTWNPPNAAVASFNNVAGKMRLTGIADGDAYFTMTVQSSQGNASASYGIGVYIPCSGTGQYYSYQCWFLGANGNSCDTTCSAVSRVSQSATITSAGSGNASSNECSNILNGLFRSSMNSFNASATASQGIGCSIFTQSGLNLGLREVANATTSGASLANFRRVCSCE